MDVLSILLKVFGLILIIVFIILGIKLILLTEKATKVVTDVEEEIENYSQVVAHLSQEDTLAFTFYPAAEKNIAVIQVRVLTTDGEAYASLPVRERIFGVLKDGVIGGDNG